MRSTFCSLMSSSILLTSLITSSTLFAPLASAEHMLQILPPRVVLADKRSANLTLVNRGDTAGDYRIFMRNIRTNEYGKFETIEDALDGELFSDKMIRYSPRRITVGAQSKQDVRVVVRKPQGLTEGEYRSHLVFRSLPKQQNLDNATDTENLAMTFNPILEVTIPVIVRHGKLSAKIEFSDIDISLAEGSSQQLLTLKINREGSRSIYGNLNVWWQQTDGKEVKIATARGVSVYFPNPVRIFTLPLESETPLKNGKLRIQYTENPNYGGDITKESIFPI